MCQQNTKIIHASMRLTERLSKSDRITEHLKSHKWLPAKQRLTKRLLLLMYKVLHGKPPRYLEQLVIGPSVLRHNHFTRSHAREAISVPQCSTKVGERAFSIAGPRAWNSLPAAIREKQRLSVFCQSLEEHLIIDAYSTN
jgi:hypothetical protein